jgi:hypothetical protein
MACDITTEQNCSALILNLFGNTSVRFTQFDGSTALPIKIGGKFHLHGNVVTSSVKSFENIIEATLPIFQACKKIPCISVPPLPCYVFAGCCNDPDHCKNVKNKDHPGNLLTDFVGLSHALICTLVSKEVILSRKGMQTWQKTFALA